MLCAVTSEERCTKLERVHDVTLKEYVREGTLQPYTRVSTLADLLEAVAVKHHEFVVVDMQVYESTPAAPTGADGVDARARILRAIRLMHASTVTILLAGRDRANVAVGDVVADGHFDLVLAYEDVSKADDWFRIMRRYKSNILQHRVRHDYRQRIRRKTDVVPARDFVELILDRAPNHSDVRDLVKDVVKDGAVLTVDKLTKVLKNQKQLSPRTLLTIFRIMYYARLRAETWPKAKIANFLSLPDTRALNRCINRTCDLTMTELDCVPYETAVEWAAEHTLTQREGRGPQIKTLCSDLISRCP